MLANERLLVQHHLETFLAQAIESDPVGYGVPWWVERDLRSYPRWGILAHGFARVRCDDCGHESLFAFSCGSRGVCPPSLSVPWGAETRAGPVTTAQPHPEP